MREPFHRAMILFHKVIEIFRVADDNGGLVRVVVVRDRGRMRATLIEGKLLRQPLGAYRLM
jgi:hypothetical protein